MSLDSSLKSKTSLTGVRSVLTRAERIARMKDERKFNDTKNSPIGIPKTRVSKA